MDEWKPVILLFADVLRPDHFSYYGYISDKPLESDISAAEVLQFTNVFSTISYTCETVPLLLTSRYPDDANHIRRYNARSEQDTYFCEWNHATGTIGSPSMQVVHSCRNYGLTLTNATTKNETSQMLTVKSSNDWTPWSIGVTYDD